MKDEYQTIRKGEKKLVISLRKQYVQKIVKKLLNFSRIDNRLEFEAKGISQ